MRNAACKIDWQDNSVQSSIFIHCMYCTHVKTPGGEADVHHGIKKKSRDGRYLRDNAAEAYRSNERCPILVCIVSRGSVATAIIDLQHQTPRTSRPSASPSLFGYRQYELPQDASHAACEPGKSIASLLNHSLPADEWHSPHRGVCPHPTWLWQTVAWRATTSAPPDDAIRRPASSHCSSIAQWLMFPAIAREEFPPKHTCFLLNSTLPTCNRYREPASKGGVRLHLQQVPRY